MQTICTTRGVPFEPAAAKLQREGRGAAEKELQRQIEQSYREREDLEARERRQRARRRRR